jgi:hypothetical protein
MENGALSKICSLFGRASFVAGVNIRQRLSKDRGGKASFLQRRVQSTTPVSFAFFDRQFTFVSCTKSFPSPLLLHKEKKALLPCFVRTTNSAGPVLKSRNPDRLLFSSLCLSPMMTDLDDNYLAFDFDDRAFDDEFGVPDHAFQGKCEVISPRQRRKQQNASQQPQPTSFHDKSPLQFAFSDTSLFTSNRSPSDSEASGVMEKQHGEKTTQVATLLEMKTTE